MQMDIYLLLLSSFFATVDSVPVLGLSCKRNFECTSKNRKYKSCQAVGRNREIVSLSLAKQRSRNQCKLGTTYGSNGRDVWVDKGCRGKFEVCTKPTSDTHDGVVCGEITCGKVKGRQPTLCEAVDLNRHIFSLEVILPMSNKPCEEGVTYGRNGRFLWTSRGCMAVFEICTVPVTQVNCYTKKCESRNNKFRTCSVEKSMTLTEVAVKKQLSKSKCLFPKSFGFKEKKIYVDHGCRAELRVCKLKVHNKVRCDSRDGGYKRCCPNSRFRISYTELDTQFSSVPCIFGKTFGSDEKCVWVDNGCRGRFAVYSELSPKLPIQGKDLLNYVKPVF